MPLDDGYSSLNMYASSNVDANCSLLIASTTSHDTDNTAVLLVMHNSFSGMHTIMQRMCYCMTRPA
jgi:hypothetical protein